MYGYVDSKSANYYHLIIKKIDPGIDVGGKCILFWKIDKIFDILKDLY